MANITFTEFTKCCFTLWFYNFIQAVDKRNEEDVTFLKKQQKENKTVLP